jgi:hypothetical protein
MPFHMRAVLTVHAAQSDACQQKLEVNPAELGMSASVVTS